MRVDFEGALGWAHSSVHTVPAATHHMAVERPTAAAKNSPDARVTRGGGFLRGTHSADSTVGVGGRRQSTCCLCCRGCCFEKKHSTSRTPAGARCCHTPRSASCNTHPSAWRLTSVDTMDTVVAAMENWVNISPSRLMPCRHNNDTSSWGHTQLGHNLAAALSLSLSRSTAGQNQHPSPPHSCECQLLLNHTAHRRAYP